MFEFAGKKILVTGGAGFLGNAVVKELAKQGVNQTDIAVPRSREFDLREKNNCLLLTRDVDLVLHLAGNVGGIGKNQRLPGTLFYDNAIMGIELMEAARKNQVKKFVCLGTICAYPKYTPVPFREEDLWIGYPEETNASYGLAKKMLLVQAQAYRQEFGFNVIYLLPVNMYGPGDNFNPDSSHVIPATIKKICDAKTRGDEFVEMWGDGTPTREFLYVEDAARGIILAAQYYDKAEPVNLGSGGEISIKDLVTFIAGMLEFKGEIRWDTSKPNGQPRRLLDVSRAEKEFQFKAQVSFRDGLQKTIEWYLKNINYE
ncbi:MAG: GDP-fucose synthetase [Candidatus Magasanikbacteria bacterium RIFCSPLOWO2_01_FULL_43_20b]|uniref:GDP-L-fucose synthase n=1 Tax=Candidatus Magasanikbacteria bacterium RIFCSPLOWO2_12_FULL_43_12 TaxID=1798692 RepID=A0A1F6MRI8_9BACT|nr:MAG: GDP-fucose synthetase [Candidatus Magasanikbacteria bacterium RIFCSPHIGHO2_02_FULL_44_13]OGH72675.1 MAG: GDP-fucose synthetase [Candidatus Magasanikbacteria bacterium RIFCSPLOWO2_02_FULL_43_22]OGH73272.1 MAG: GDP-fucose synthetase [Candidatus Magasanikbacteria bacterium RIFCSPLOWO2_01_FULL_43_20b]OGH74279.1 MAG: GDP-fucose synthetase [Candidatus Magasanikbacteria bacterium RIFCSPLOWO2_12_FULL_43_12]